MNSKIKHLRTALFSTLLSLSVVANANAENALFHSGQASVNSIQALGHGVAAIGKTAVTIVAVPLVGIGKVGGLSERAGEALFEAANTPLEIGKTYAVAGPSPDKAITREGE